MSMRSGPVLVVGPGAMGCLVSALLTEGGLDVVLVDRDFDRARRLTETGLHISGPDPGAERTVAVRVLVAPLDFSDLGRPSLAFLCVKAGDTEVAVAPLAKEPGLVWAVLQNGLGRAEAVAELIGAPERVVGVLTTEGATRLGEGRISHAGRGQTRLGPLVAEGKPAAQAVCSALEAAGLAPELTDDLARLTWEKLQVNAAINAVAALLGQPNGALLESPAAAALADEAAEEVARVALAKGVLGDWSAELAHHRWRAVAEATKHNNCSTLQDLIKGRSTEVFAINGAVVQVANSLGLSALVNRALAQLVQAREELSHRPQQR